MRFHRFFIDQPLAVAKKILIDETTANQWLRVLRFKIGDQVILFDSQGSEFVSTIINLEKNTAQVKIESIINRQEKQRLVTLFCAILKKENFELTVAKATEVGIYKIVPIITARTVKLNLNQQRLKKIIKESAEQSGRLILPTLAEPVDFEKSVSKHRADSKNNFIFLPGGPQPTWLIDVPANILIGPEGGGFNDDEIKLVLDHGFKSAGLGPFTLRAETAAIIASWLSVS